MNIRKLVKPEVRSLTAYNAKEIPCKVKLDANESPYSVFRVSKGQRVKVQKIFQTLNRYPDPEAKALKKVISKNLGLKPENILMGNGSDELIYYLITIFGGPVLYPIPTFSMYGIITQALGEKRIEIPLDKEFDLDIGKILGDSKEAKPKLIFLSSPNNPTGNCFSADKILKIIETSSSVTRHPALVVIDEAYQPFSSRRGFLPLLKDYKNLVIMRTLSKTGLAGLRVGFLIADKGIINEVNKVRLPFNLNSFSQTVAVETLGDRSAMEGQIRLIISERERLFDELTKINNIKPYPSEANFILFKTGDSDKIYNRLLKKGVLIRNMRDVVNNCLRVTIGTKRENDFFLKALKGVMS